MSSKGGRGAKVAQKAKQTLSRAQEELSSISTASFLEGLQSNNGHPLHSTALEEDLQPSQAEGPKMTKVGKQTGVHETKEPTSRPRGAAAKRKQGPEEEEEEENAGKRRKRSVKAKGKPSRVVLPSSPEEVKQQPQKDKKTQNEKPSSSQDGLTSGGTLQRRRNIASSDDELEDDDKNWTPVSDKTKTLVSSRKPSTCGRSSPGTKSRRAQKGAAVKKRLRHKAKTELDVILDAFLDFSNEYRDSVECEAIKRSIGTFTSSVKEQLEEQMSSYQELSALKRDNSKNASQTRLKSKTLLEAKYELMRAKRKKQQLQKQKDALRLRLADLRRGSALLQDVRGLQGRYLDFRRGNRKEEETYGASSLPALMLEAQLVQTAEQQLTRINARLEKEGI